VLLSVEGVDASAGKGDGLRGWLSRFALRFTPSLFVDVINLLRFRSTIRS